MQYNVVEITEEELENRTDTPIVHVIVQGRDGRKAHIHLSLGLNQRNQAIARVTSAHDNPVSKQICAHWN